ncbi:MAG TPA: pseudouridine synthase, partial [Pirellulales bacterium]|nr:pseudouridine synthase [Pirellulales bacterium]
DFENPPWQCIDFAHGKPAVTDWRVVERIVDRTRLELAPFTGRSHQLRLHLQQIGHPILGDKLYAHEAARAMADRLLLYATQLRLIHPVTGEPMIFISPCPF